MGFTVIPGSKNVSHIKDNFDILKLKLDEDDMKKIASLDKNKKYNEQTDAKLDAYAHRAPVYEKP